MVLNHNFDVALRLAGASLFIHPCEPGGPTVKKPFVTGWKTLATNIASEIENLWSTYPQAIPGIATGKSGLVAIDIDVKKIDGVAAFDDLLTQHGDELPRCPATRTPSKGFHLIFRQPAGRAPLGNRTGGLPKGIDVRGEGGNLIAPGSVLSTGEFYDGVAGWPDLAEAYATNTIPVIPDWLLQIIDACPAGHNGQERVLASSPCSSDDITWHRRLNNAALANLSAWVPALGLYRCRRARGGGFEAVAVWRPSSTGRPDEIRKLNLKIHPLGINDFGAAQKFTPIDLVMIATGRSQDEAFGFLVDAVGWR
jgi:Bifunctional DNA primase/polymerase, N-terminal